MEQSNFTLQVRKEQFENLQKEVLSAKAILNTPPPDLILTKSNTLFSNFQTRTEIWSEKIA